MEIFNYSTLSFIIIQCALCLVSYIIYHKRYRTISNVQSVPTSNTEQMQPKKTTETKKPKQNFKKPNQKKDKPPKKRKTSTMDPANDSDTESYTLEEQLAQAIMSQQLAHDVINTAAVNAKPTVKKFEPSFSKMKHGTIVKDSVFVRDEDWESVVSKKHKKKLYPVSRLEGENKFSFTLDEEGGIVELQMCEICFPAESVTQPLDVTIEFENYKKFVDDTEERVFLTPAAYFTVDGDEFCLGRKFTMKLNTKRMMGRGWDGNVCCQIETKDSDGSWISTGRTEYLFGKPVHIASDELTSYRAVLTRGHNGAISRNLNIAAYIAKPRQQNPEFHVIHLCVYDKSDQSKYKMETNMQNLLVKMPPKTCNVTFGSDLQFRIKPTQKYSPDEKDVFMRWAEICKAFVNVKFQIRLTKNETDDPNFEADLRSVVYLEILKVSPTATVTQEEYFHFYWISANIFPKKRNKSNKQPVTENGDKKVPGKDGFASKSNNAKQVKKGDSTNQNAPIAMVTTEKETNTQRKRKKKISQSSNTSSSQQFHPEKTSEDATRNATSPKDISASKNHILTEKVQSMKTPGVLTNQIPSQVKHDRNSANQNGSARFEKLPQKVGKDTTKPQYFNNYSNKVQSNVSSQGNSQNRSQKSSKASSQDLSRNSKSLDSKSSQDVASKPFRRIFRYRSPSKKRGKHENANSEVTKTENKNKKPFVPSRSDEKKPILNDSGPKTTDSAKPQNRNARLVKPNEKTEKGTKNLETKVMNGKKAAETNFSGPKVTSPTQGKDAKMPNSNEKNNTKRNSENGKNTLDNSSSKPPLIDSTKKVGEGNDQRRKAPRNRRKNNETHERARPMTHDAHERPVSADDRSDGRKPAPKQDARKQPPQSKHDMDERSQPVRKDMHERSQPVKDSHEWSQKRDGNKRSLQPKNDMHDRSQPIKQNSHQRPLSSNAQQQKPTASKNSNPGNIKSSPPNHFRDKEPPKRNPSEQNKDRINDRPPKPVGQQNSDHRMTRNPRSYPPKKERSFGYQRDGFRQKVPQKQQNGPQNQQNGPQKKPDEIKNKSVPNGESRGAMPNGVADPTHATRIDEAPKERRQRNQRNRRKGPQNDQVNHIEPQVSQ